MSLAVVLSAITTPVVPADPEPEVGTTEAEVDDSDCVEEILVVD